MAARHKARKRALDLLYAADLRGEDARETLTAAVAEGNATSNPYSVTLVEGVCAHRQRIDELLEEYSQGWPLRRMPPVDRNVLRIGLFELLYAADVPAAVAVSEATLLVRELSTDDSPGFVNGILGALQRDRDRLLSAERPGGSQPSETQPSDPGPS